MNRLRWIVPAFAIALLPLWACEAQDAEEGSDTLIIEEDTEPDVTVEDRVPDIIVEEPDTIIQDTDGVQGEVRVGDDGVEGEVRVDDN